MFFDEEFELILMNRGYHLKFIHFLTTIPEVLLILDSVLKFITGFYENGVVVTDKIRIIQNYYKNELIYDIIAYLPVVMQRIFQQMFPDISLGLKILQFLMFFKIKWIKNAIAKYEEIIASNGKKDFLLKFVKLLYVIIFVTHLNACLWHSIAYFYPSDSCCTWLEFNGLKEATKVSKYIYAFYYAITIGFGGNITPQNEIECIFGAIILLISLQMFGYCINSMKSILDVMMKQENKYK